MPSNLDSKFSQFLVGFSAPVRALQLLLVRPKLLSLFALPMMITLTTVAVLIYALLIGAWSWSQAAFHSAMGAYAGILSGTLTMIIGIIVLFFSFQVLSLLIALVSSPFNDLLAEETERACGEREIKLGFPGLVRVFFLDLRKTILALTLLSVLTLFGFIPVIGMLSYLGLSLVSAFIYITYPLNRRKKGVGATLHWMRIHFFRSLGFGMATTLLFSIPVLNFFALPLSVIGGTLVYLKK